MKTTRNLLIAVIVLFSTIQLNAQQWTLVGSDIHNNNSGNVGVGTSAPSELLTVHNATGWAKLQVERPMTTGTGNCAAVFAKNSATGDLYFFGLKKMSVGYNAVQSIYDASTSTWRAFSVVNSITGKYEMRNGITDAEYKNAGDILFNNTGAFGVGMGTTSIPSGVKMAVNGKINCKEVEVTLTGWSDFVFAEDYNLRTLEEVEAYINENNHLPDVPSEKEVLENGVNIGEMNSTLLRKIEELTLYMIELKKENEQMKAQIEVLMEK
jgi:hypothetical protein